MTDTPKPTYTWGQKYHALKRQLGPYKNVLLTLTILNVLLAGANGFVPYITGKFLDLLIAPAAYEVPGFGSIPGWAYFLGLWALIQVVANTVSWFTDRTTRHLTTELQAGLQSRAFQHLLTLPVSFHKHHRVGELTDIVNKAGWMLESMTNTVLSIAPQFLTIAIGIAISFAIEPRLALILLIGVGVYLFALARVLPPMAGYQEEGHKAWNRAYGDAYDAFANIQTVKQSGAELYERSSINAAFYEKAIPLWYRIEKTWSNLNVAQRFVVTATQGAIFLFSVYFIQTGDLTIGGLIAFNAYAGMIIGPFVSLGSQWQTIQNGLTAVARSEIIFGTEPENYEPENAIPLPEVQGEIAFDDVHFTHEVGSKEILKGVSFVAEAGEVIALVGETGAGKSTTMDLVSGYYFPTAGSIRIDSHDIRDVNLRDLRSHIAVVPQEVVLFNASILDNIRYGRKDATDEEVREAARKAQADAFIETFPDKYEQVVGERGVKLSVGQKQRIAIARAILRNPRILILDEPTSALDTKTERYITKQLEELMKGRTTFVIAHRLSTVRKANKILVLKDGRIAEEGTHEQLISIPNGEYYRLYALHIGLHE